MYIRGNKKNQKWGGKMRGEFSFLPSQISRESKKIEEIKKVEQKKFKSLRNLFTFRRPKKETLLLPALEKKINEREARKIEELKKFQSKKFHPLHNLPANKHSHPKDRMSYWQKLKKEAHSGKVKEVKKIEEIKKVQSAELMSFRKRSDAEHSQKLASYWQSPKKEVATEKVEKVEPKKMEPYHSALIAKYSKEALLRWRTPEFEMFKKDKKWYLLILAILVAIVVYAIFMDSLIMAATFILIGVVGYIYINKEPRLLDFMITKDGIIAGKEIYTFENLKSFWIFCEPDDIRVISAHTESYLNPYIHIPIANEDPAKIREILLQHIPEEKHAPGLAEVLDRFLRL